MSNHAIDNAQGWAEIIGWLHECWQFGRDDLDGCDMSRKAKRTLRYEFNYDGGMVDRYDVVEAVEEHARESILSVEVRSDWHVPGGDCAPSQYCLLLSTGGPALRIIGNLNRWCEPADVEIQWQDWGTPWTEFMGNVDSDALMWFVSLFFYGEGS